MILKPKHAALAVVALAFHTDMLLYYLLVPLLPRYARELHLDQLHVGLLFGSYAACLLVSTFPLGRAVDRFGRRAVMLCGLLGLGAATLLFAFVHSYWLLVLARGLQGIAGAATWLPGMALLADHFPAEERGAAMGVAFSAANLGGLLGPPLSGFLVEHVSATAPFILGAALVLLDAAGRAFLLEEAHAELPPPIPFRQLWREPVVRAFAGAMVLGSGLWALLESTLPLHLDHHFGLGPKAIGLCFAGAVAAHTLTSPLMGRLSDRLGRARVLRAGLALCALLIPAVAFAPGVALIVAALAALGFAASCVMAPCSPAMAGVVDGMESRSYGSAFAILNVSYSIGMMIGPFVGSGLVQGLGLRTAFLLAGLGYAAYLLAVRKIRV